MKIALIDNGSLEPAAHRHLRASAAALSAASGLPVEAVSWRHSDRAPAAELDGAPAATLRAWVRSRVACGEREFVFVPYLASASGAIASAIRRDLGELARETGGFSWVFSAGLDAPGLAEILAARVLETLAAGRLSRPAVVLVDHGGPERASADLRDAVAAGIRERLGQAVAAVAPASMESPDGPEFAFNRPLLAEILSSNGFDRGDVVVAPLFLSPGRHAGPGGDLERIARAAEERRPGLACHFTGLIGSHPLTSGFLARGLIERLPAPAVL
jgi:hypothetical protein